MSGVRASETGLEEKTRSKATDTINRRRANRRRFHASRAQTASKIARAKGSKKGANSLLSRLYMSQ